MKRYILILILTVLCILTFPTVLADTGYEILPSSGWIDDNKITEANGCYLMLEVNNSSHNMLLDIKKPDGFQEEKHNITPNLLFNYYDQLRIYVVDVNYAGGQAYLELSRPSGTTGGSANGTKIYCNFPGQTALGGDKVSFPIVIQNNNNDDRTYDLSASSDQGWNMSFSSGGTTIYKVDVPAKQSSTISLDIMTTSSSGIGERKATAKIGDEHLDLFVDITNVNHTTELSAKYTSAVASIGDKIFYELHIHNMQPNENDYMLSVTGLPDNWYYSFKEDMTSANEMAEVIVPASSDKTVYLQVAPPYSVQAGEYNLTAVVVAPNNDTMTKNLMLKLKSSANMLVRPEKISYDTKPGQAVEFDLPVENNGTGASLTNVRVESQAPTGWIVKVTPDNSNIRAGEYQKFHVRVESPGSVQASEYPLTLKVTSDQTAISKDFSINVTTDSYIPYIGGAVIIVVAAALLLVVRKFGRR